jgi:predicted nuclease of predicted toxin-antitoxin system
MRLLIDEQFPFDYVAMLAGPTVLHVHSLGWMGVKNGALLRQAHGVCEVFVTLDKSLPFQQNIKILPFGVVVVRAKSNRIDDLKPLVPEILEAAKNVKPGQVIYVGA